MDETDDKEATAIISFPLPVRADEDTTELDFTVRQVVITYGAELGPGSHGKMVPYLKYGLGAVCEPDVSLVRGDGKKAVILVPLPAGGMMKLSDLKKRANHLWRQAKATRDSLE